MSNALPNPHRYAVCAPEDMPIKSFYQGVFEEVFIFFHPFIKPKQDRREAFPDKNKRKMIGLK
ncbi:hypothetical protein [Virgibacillus pantothenticus]|uniref:hypothetical protein n=1 Tax=Virgibacillus pantothenticus TaxID=1473 RepID=UPI0025B07729|nr:hypothetical protein [Virgibacillus pantothenticus]